MTFAEHQRRFQNWHRKPTVLLLRSFLTTLVRRRVSEIDMFPKLVPTTIEGNVLTGIHKVDIY